MSRFVSDLSNRVRLHRRWLKAAFKQWRSRKARFIVVSLPGAAVQSVFDKERKEYFQIETRSDLDRSVLHQVFSKDEYNLKSLARGDDIVAAYGAIVAAGKRPFIFDFGANIGVTSVYLKRLYPEATIVAVEPAPDNFELAQRNCAPFGGILVLQAAVAADSGFARLVDPGLGHSGLRTEADVSGSIPLVSVQQLLDTYCDEQSVPFFAKFDIEGAEKDVFSGSTTWFDRFVAVSIETHDRLFPKGANSAPILAVLGGSQRDFEFRSESIFSVSNAGLNATSRVGT